MSKGGHTIVVGGTRGIGREVTRLFSERGCPVSVIGLREPYDRDRVRGANVAYGTVDITKKREFCATLDGFASGPHGKITNMVFCQRYRGKEDAWEGELATSVTATRNAIEHVVQAGLLDLERPCSIVIIGSVVGRFVADESPVGYLVAKAALDQLARYYGLTLADRGARVNCVLPGTVLKEESQDFYLKDTGRDALFRGMNPMKRMGSSGDIARAAWLMCTEDAAFITGQSLIVDGGLSLRWQETLGKRLNPELFSK